MTRVDLPPLGVEATRPAITAARARAAVIAGRARAIIAFTAVASGVAMARAWPGITISTWLAVSVGAAIPAAMSIVGRGGGGRWWPGPALAIALLALAAAFSSMRVAASAPTGLEALFPGDGPAAVEARPIRVRGVLLDDPVRVQRVVGQPVTTLAGFLPSSDGCVARLRLEAVLTEAGWARASGHVRLRIRARPSEEIPVHVAAGGRVEVAGQFRPVTGPTNPGQPDARGWARASGYAGSITVPESTLIAPIEASGPGPPGPGGSFSPGGPAVMAGPLFEVSSGGPGQTPGPLVSRWRAICNSLDRGVLRFRAELLRRASSVLGPAPSPATPARPGRTLLADLLLGIESPADPGLSQAFTRLGLAHVLAISGFHLVVLAAVSLALLRLTGDRGPLEPAIVAGAVILYLLIIPPSAPVLRSGVMVLSLLAAESLGRRYDRLTVLAWTACGLVLLKPADLEALGFQLSYGLTGLLLWLGPRFHTALFGVHLRGTLDGPGRLEPLRRLVSTSILCWAVAAPAIAWHTGLFSPLAVLSTVVVTPLILLLLWAGFAGLLIGVLFPSLASVLGPGLLIAADLTAGVVRRLDGLPGVSVRIPMFSVGLAAAATAVVLYWIRFGRRRDSLAFALTACVAAWGAVELAGHGRQGLRPGALLRLDMLDAGRGSCALIRTPERVILWDCGGGPAFGRLDLPRAARALGAGPVRTAILSHADLAHFSAILDAAERLGLEEVLVTPALPARARAEPQGPAAIALCALRDRGLGVRALAAGDELDLGRARLRVVSPPGEAAWEGDDLRSLVAVVELKEAGGSGGLVLTGQLADDAVSGIVASGQLVRGGVLLLPARGSMNALRELLIESAPAVIIAGGDEATDFGEIWGGEASIWQTSESGAIAATLTPAGWMVETARPGPAR